MHHLTSMVQRCYLSHAPSFCNLFTHGDCRFFKIVGVQYRTTLQESSYGKKTFGGVIVCFSFGVQRFPVHASIV